MSSALPPTTDVGLAHPKTLRGSKVMELFVRARASQNHFKNTHFELHQLGCPCRRSRLLDLRSPMPSIEPLMLQFRLQNSLVGCPGEHTLHLLDIPGPDKINNQLVVFSFSGELADGDHLSGRQYVITPRENLQIEAVVLP